MLSSFGLRDLGSAALSYKVGDLGVSSGPSPPPEGVTLSSEEAGHGALITGGKPSCSPKAKDGGPGPRRRKMFSK